MKRQWSKTRAMETVRLMLKRRYNSTVKEDLQMLLRLLRAGQLNDAYEFVNYEQRSLLEYKMPSAMWNWLNSQQPAWVPIPAIDLSPGVIQMCAGETCGAFMADGSPMV